MLEIASFLSGNTKTSVNASSSTPSNCHVPFAIVAPVTVKSGALSAIVAVLGIVAKAPSGNVRASHLPIKLASHIGGLRLSPMPHFAVSPDIWNDRIRICLISNPLIVYWSVSNDTSVQLSYDTRNR